MGNTLKSWEQCGSLAFLNQGQHRIQKLFKYFSHVFKLFSNTAEKPSSKRQVPFQWQKCSLTIFCTYVELCFLQKQGRGAQPRYQSRPLETLIYLSPHAQTLPLGAPCATSSILHFHVKLPATAWQARGAGTAASQLPDQTACTARTTRQAKLSCSLPAILAL